MSLIFLREEMIEFLVELPGLDDPMRVKSLLGKQQI